MIFTIIRLGIVRAMRNKFALLCQTLALFAILTPIMLIFALKYGIVSSLKENLLKNPTMLEVRPTDGVEISKAALAQIQSWEETAFVLPTISAAYSSICVQKDTPIEVAYPSYTVVSTAEGDPILSKNQIKVPGMGEVVVTEPLAAELGLQVQDKVVLTAWRNANKERYDYTATVVGILPDAYSRNMKQVYAPVSYTYEAELFLTTGKGKKNLSPKLTAACYNGLVTNTKDSAKVKALGAYVAEHWDVCTAEQARMPGVDGQLQVLYSPVNRLSANDVATMMLYAAGHGLSVYPWVNPFEVQLPQTAGGHVLQLLPLDRMVGHADTCAATPVLYVNPAAKTVNDTTLEMQAHNGMSRIRVKMEAQDWVPANTAYAAPQLVAMLWAASQRALVWDYEEGVYYAPLGAYCHMRLYARNLEGVEPLLKKVQELGIPSVANTFAIKRVFALERSLHNLFLIICMGAGIGAAVSYALSLFNAAELHRRDYAIVQLLGCGRISLVVMPFIDALLTSLASFFLSLGAYAVISSLISCMFAETAGGDVVCRLEYVHIFAFGFASLALAVVAAVVAAIKVLSVSPSEIIRES